MAGRGRQGRGQGQGGFALITVTGILALMFLLGLALTNLGRRAQLDLESWQGRSAAYYLALEGMALARRELADYKARGRINDLMADGSWHPFGSARGQGSYSIQDEAGKFNLNQMNSGQLDEVLTKMGLEEGRRQVVRDSLLDWIDRDSLVRGAGAEEAYYQNLRPPYLPRNGPFTNPGELVLARGLDAALVFGLAGASREYGLPAGLGLWSLFTVYERGRKINLNSAPWPVLASLPGLDLDAARKLWERRRQGLFKNTVEVKQIIGDLRFRQAASLIRLNPGVTFTVISRARDARTGARHAVMAVMRNFGRGPLALQDRFWVDDLPLPVELEIMGPPAAKE